MAAVNDRGVAEDRLRYILVVRIVPVVRLEVPGREDLRSQRLR